MILPDSLGITLRSTTDHSLKDSTKHIAFWHQIDRAQFGKILPALSLPAKQEVKKIGRHSSHQTKSYPILLANPHRSHICKKCNNPYCHVISHSHPAPHWLYFLDHTKRIILVSEYQSMIVSDVTKSLSPTIICLH